MATRNGRPIAPARCRSRLGAGAWGRRSWLAPLCGHPHIRGGWAVSGAPTSAMQRALEKEAPGLTLNAWCSGHELPAEFAHQLHHVDELAARVMDEFPSRLGHAPPGHFVLPVGLSVFPSLHASSLAERSGPRSPNSRADCPTTPGGCRYLSDPTTRGAAAPSANHRCATTVATSATSSWLSIYGQAIRVIETEAMFSVSTHRWVVTSPNLLGVARTTHVPSGSTSSTPT